MVNWTFGPRCLHQADSEADESEPSSLLLSLARLPRTPHGFYIRRLMNWDFDENWKGKVKGNEEWSFSKVERQPRRLGASMYESGVFPFLFLFFLKLQFRYPFFFSFPFPLTFRWRFSSMIKTHYHLGARDTVRETVNPDTVRETVNPDTVRETVNPDTVRETVNPDTVRETVNPDTVRKTVNPDTVRETVNPDTVRETVNPDTAPEHDWKCAEKCTAVDCWEHQFLRCWRKRFLSEWTWFGVPPLDLPRQK